MVNKKSTKKHKKRLLKRDILIRRHNLKVLSSLFVAVALAVVAFNFALMVRGGWDDISMTLALAAPTAGVVAFMIASINIAKYQSRGIELIPSVAIIVLSGIFFCVSLIGTSMVETHKKELRDAEHSISAEYVCSYSEDSEVEIGIRMTSTRFWKIYELNNLEHYVTGSYGLIEDDNTYLSVRVSENYAPAELGLDETHYEVEFNDGMTLRGANNTFYCKQV